MAKEAMIDILKQVIKEVKEESKENLITESKQVVKPINEEKEMRTFVTKQLIEALRVAENNDVQRAKKDHK